MSLSRDWGPEPLLKTLCPIDHTKRRPSKKQRGDYVVPVIHSGSADGMQLIFGSFNGNVFQVRILFWNLNSYWSIYNKVPFDE